MASDWANLLNILFLPSCGFQCSVLIFFVGTSSFENDVAWESVLHREAELGLVENVLLGLLSRKKKTVREATACNEGTYSEIDLDGAG